MNISPTNEMEPVPRLIRYGRELQNPDIAGIREFLMVSGDMYCSSSFAGNTRRYHGLLVHQNSVLLSGLHDEVNGIRLSGGWWGDTFLGDGLSWTTGAMIYPVIQEFAIPGARVIRSFFFDGGFTIRYEVFGTVSLIVRPLMTRRPVHELSRDPVVEVSEDRGHLILNGCKITGGLEFSPDMQWYLNAHYPREQEQGYDAWEDLVSPGYFSGTISDGVVEICFKPIDSYSTITEKIGSEYNDILTHASRLCVSNGQIRVAYHWFTESWGRDTFISLPGLLLETGRFREAEDVFRWHIAHRNGGLLINRFPDSFHTADGTLWFFWALFQYVQKLPGSPFIATIRHDLEEILQQYAESEVASLSGNLITVQECSTWMDTPSTPRKGIPVEINALWILALELSEFLKLSTPVRSADARREFYTFWNEDAGCLYDILDPDDSSIRSNQIIPLAFGLIPFDQGRRALSVIKRELLTPYGIRTLAPGSSGYDGRFTGDASYHNGMVWPWQMGFYIDALIQYGEDIGEIRKVIEPLWHYFLTDGTGMLPEMFNGDAPHQQAGNICQAWSIGELIRARQQIIRSLKIIPDDESDK
ncbi:MAG: amylo-alpha-1,6-glucosidase [Methanomicrobiales archaeon HGW-Methanomicrobiales-4]|nr:MAG: amylo-alpha-1,6-glucosidase [Methanomicrobiales archaeon HGW-Methanomicrobiales-4]